MVSSWLAWFIRRKLPKNEAHCFWRNHAVDIIGFSSCIISCCYIYLSRVPFFHHLYYFVVRLKNDIKCMASLIILLPCIAQLWPRIKWVITMMALLYIVRWIDDELHYYDHLINKLSFTNLTPIHNHNNITAKIKKRSLFKSGCEGRRYRHIISYNRILFYGLLFAYMYK